MGESWQSEKNCPTLLSKPFLNAPERPTPRLKGGNFMEKQSANKIVDFDEWKRKIRQRTDTTRESNDHPDANEQREDMGSPVKPAPTPTMKLVKGLSSPLLP